MNKSKANINAFDKAAYYITYRDRTKKEVYDKLKEKGYSSHDIDDAIFKLIEYGYVDDERYALSYIRSNINSKGINRIIIELGQKGIKKDIIQECLKISEFNEYETIKDIFKRRYSDIDLNDERCVRKIFSYFSRRGFKFECIHKVIAEYKKQ